MEEMGDEDQPQSFPSVGQNSSYSRGCQDRQLETDHLFWCGWRIPRGGLGRRMFPKLVYGGLWGRREEVSFKWYSVGCFTLGFSELKFPIVS